MEKEIIDLSETTERLEILCSKSQQMHRTKYEAI